MFYHFIYFVAVRTGEKNVGLIENAVFGRRRSKWKRELLLKMIDRKVNVMPNAESRRRKKTCRSVGQERIFSNLTLVNKAITSCTQRNPGANMLFLHWKHNFCRHRIARTKNQIQQMALNFETGHFCRILQKQLVNMTQFIIYYVCFQKKYIMLGFKIDLRRCE